MRNPRAVGKVACGAALLLAVWILPRPVHAEAWQTPLVITVGSVFGVADVLFIAYDLTMSERNRSPSRGLARAELVVMCAQLAIGLSMFATGLQSDQRLDSIGAERDLYLPLGGIMAVMAVPLLLHGVRHTVYRTGGGMHTFQLMPVRVGDQRASGPGLALVGRF